MRITTLSGRIPLTKTIAFVPSTHTYNVSPYPMVRRMSSTTHVAASLKEFERIVRDTAAKGHCLLKGNLDAELRDESRAGHSLDEPHEWIVFDFDKVDCAPTIDGAIAAIRKYLPFEAHTTDALIQLSASCFKPDATHLSCHVFMLLDKPMDTQLMRGYFEHINLKYVRDEITLTDSGMALHYPVDRTVHSPAKLLYVSPPKCVGFKPRINDPIHFLKGKQRKLVVPAFSPPSSDELSALRDALRDQAQLPRLDARISTKNGVEYMMGVKETCVIHDIQKSGDTYLRFNMNGGDSLAYYINLREPHIIGNFKGDPFLYTKEVAPDLYKSLTKSAKALSPNASTVEGFAFYCTNRNSAVYIGSYNRETDDLQVFPSNETAAGSWLRSFGVPPMMLPHMELVYDMHSDTRYEPGFPLINLYEKTDFIKQYGDIERHQPVDGTALDALRKKCPVIYKTLHSLSGDTDAAVLKFCEWLAYIFQFRTRPETAWLFHGVEGTGKGTLFHHILRPLLGARSSAMVMYKDTEGEFNAFLEGKLMIVVDEAELGLKRDADELAARFRNWITEPIIGIRAMREGLREAPNHCAFIIFANSEKPVKLPRHDRRYNVAERQNKRLVYTPNEYGAITQGTELPDFAEFLGTLIVDDSIKTSVYAGESKERIIEATHSLLERVINAIKTGDGDFFVENCPTDIQMRIDYAGKSLPLKEYRELLHAMRDGTLNALSRTDLYILMRVVMPDVREFPENPAQQRKLWNTYELLPARGKTVWCKRSKKPVSAIQAPEWRFSDDNIPTVLKSVI